ncbi:hypothetical protein [Deinococcus maricopensis]|uniref:Putative rod shape-determining protein MreD putative membrane protein n=1 Tax=Deinococcus maricopensis (strain DSM 21211 / LMG 22137 / NRRL B-23946 / LB-34) TaxID=709986 RepID=E8UAC2_DEIML|nr:hypothetical protein [Deinococcus maricopensis]ADV68011.1 putative rod shape-determining protein MreD; putative membrane protein [Deinococcus maricopensis DSM 21211]
MRPLLFLLLLVGLQGALSALLPAQLTPPDLFLLTAVAVALRWRPGWALLGAYGLGLVQDALGHGLLGLHAAGAAGGVLLVLGLRKFLSDRGLLQTLVTVVTAVVGQWATFLVLTYWLRGGLVTQDALVQVLPVQLAFTLLVAPTWARLSGWAFGRQPSPEEGLV